MGHKPLETISQKPLGKAPACLQGLLLDVQHYVPKIVFRKGKDLIIGDLLSKDCKPEETAESATQDIEALAIIPMATTTLEELMRHL